MKTLFEKPLFFWPYHVGQVFSIGWAKKIGKCAVFDFDSEKVNKFKSLKVTTEEPELKKYLKNIKKKLNFANQVKE